MATKKKAKSKKVKKATKAKSTAKSARSEEAKPRVSVANFVRDQLARDVPVPKIVEKAGEAFPDKKPTAGYVNWIKEHAPNVSTTHNANATM